MLSTFLFKKKRDKAFVPSRLSLKGFQTKTKKTSKGGEFCPDFFQSNRRILKRQKRNTALLTWNPFSRHEDPFPLSIRKRCTKECSLTIPSPPTQPSRPFLLLPLLGQSFGMHLYLSPSSSPAHLGCRRVVDGSEFTNFLF